MDTYPTWRNLPAMLFDRARLWADRPMMRSFRNGAWHRTSWGEFSRQTASCARRLLAAGVAPGDRVLVCAENRPEILMAETALMAIRAVPVPVYTTNTVADHVHVLSDSGARAAIVSSAVLAGRLRDAGRQAGGLDLLVVMDGPPEGEAGHPRLVPWVELVADQLPPDDVAAAAGLIPGTALACLIYTSGTAGAPKGVMLAHRCILSNCRGAFLLLRTLGLHRGPRRNGPTGQVYLSYLPASHSYEHTVGMFFLPSVGTEIVYARGVEYLAADLMTVQPTILTAVPRVLEVIRARMLAQMSRQPGWQRRLFDRTLAIGCRRLEGAPLSLADRLLDPLLEHLVRRKVRARFGGRLVAAVSGGARLDPEVGRFFLALGIRIVQGYGQTEAGPVIAANPPHAIRIDTVGQPLDGVDLRIAEDGEILVRGDLVMDGYWGRPEDTGAAIRDGWLHTGDIGALDADRYLRITDRKKDIIVLSGGENVSPARVEGLLMAEPEIAQVVVSGNGHPALSALVVPAEGYDAAAAALAISRVNMRLSVTERIRRHVVVPPFTLENGLLTPTQKIRRPIVLQENEHVLAQLRA